MSWRFIKVSAAEWRISEPVYRCCGYDPYNSDDAFEVFRRVSELIPEL